jgi:hypothetical protein
MPVDMRDVEKVIRKSDQMAAELDGRQARATLHETAKNCALWDAPAAVRADIGDLSMSNWWRGRPIEIVAQAPEGKATPLQAVVEPKGRARGPWRVLQDGRRAMSAGEGKLRFVQTKTKGLRTRHRIVKRNQGATAGKNTWSDATVLMTVRAKREVPNRIDKAFVRIWKG